MNLICRVAQLIVTLEFRGNGLFQVGQAIGRGVFGLAVTDGLDRCLLDVIRRVEIRFSSAETSTPALRSSAAFVVTAMVAEGSTRLTASLSERAVAMSGLLKLRELA
jgi:hypothetical protein